MMKPKTLLLVLGALLILTVAGCGGAAETAAPVPTAVAVTAPPDMVTAREGVLDFLRTSANQCVPPEGAGWRSEPGGANTPAGYEVVRFYSDACVMTVSHPMDGEHESVYHVAIGDTLTGFCWQAIVDENGQVIATGMEAQSIPGLGNPAAQYCEEQGYTFDIINRDSGGQCGVCIFPDGSMCNVWGYFHGVCQPGDFPASGE